MEWKPCGNHRSRIYRINQGRMVRAGGRVGILRWRGRLAGEDLVAILFGQDAELERLSGLHGLIPPGEAIDDVCQALLRSDFPELFPEGRAVRCTPATRHLWG